jgi:hypothetical protein
MGGLLTLGSFLKVFPEIDTQHPPEGQTASYVSNIQGGLSCVQERSDCPD